LLKEIIMAIPEICKKRGKTEAERKFCHEALVKAGLVKGKVPVRGTGGRGNSPTGMQRFLAGGK